MDRDLLSIRLLPPNKLMGLVREVKQDLLPAQTYQKYKSVKQMFTLKLQTLCQIQPIRRGRF